MNRRITQVAVAAAAAMALSLATPVSAQAADSSPAKRGSVSTAVTAPVTTSATGAVRFTSHAVLNSSSSTYARTAVSISAPGAVSWYVRGDVFVNGVLRVRDTSIASHNYPTGRIYWPRAAGYGTAQLRNVRVESYDAANKQTVSPLPASNVIRVRRSTGYLESASIVKRGSKLTIKAKNWRVYQPNGSTVRVPKITVKRYYKGKWRNVKHVKLNRNGHGKASWKSKKKYKYRVYLKTTSTVQGTFLYWPRKI
ncbi:hypothetical protein H1W00_04800 [Aeromicrobium sp. Marseille-Q0843]|uniref:Surface layer protein A domain-containing protein n=1 Tax=Aeromicrobium phoceense TaxID=2754045 RepID=A0A838XLP3_9ACTN|nr:hypothetical protein [Aeromicrobium phoceense]MBA4607790.1 hypothetical protein [Aeromicrobium phoceense]